MSYIFIGIGAKDTASTMEITTDGNTVFDDRAVLFFGAEYQASGASFMSRYIGATNNRSNNVGLVSWIPIPFSSGITISFTNLSGRSMYIWYTVVGYG